MSYYLRQGEIPQKRHIAFRKQDGSLYYEEHVSREGFSGIYSNLYHLKMPTRVKRVGALTPISLERAGQAHCARHLKTFDLPAGGDVLSARRALFFNEDLRIFKSHPQSQQNCFFRNGHFDALVFVQKGAGCLQSQFGLLDFSAGDYLIIPRGVIYRLDFDFQKEAPSLLILESASPIQTPRRYRNAFGQLLEHSPFSERDIRSPCLSPPKDEAGDFRVQVILKEGIQEYVYDSHPFDVVGWDGGLYPWALNIHRFDPIVGRIHQPPPVHQTFEGAGFVVCSFVSRPFDFHPEAIPAPYPHSNVDSDEVLFYSAGQFMSRKGIYEESLTYHPMGLAHGPQPGRYEASIGQKSTEELAVMIDTFRPLCLTPEALSVDDEKYALSWLG